MTEQNGIDRAMLEDLLESVGGDREFLAELLASFQGDALAQIAAMQAALAAGHAKDLQRASHSLKSSSAAFGAMRLSQLCKEVEEMAEAGAWQGAAPGIERIAAEYDRTRTALDTIVRGA
jgi:HPt (histidine-containing phosphotransfer) domain-containing protein